MITTAPRLLCVTHNKTHTASNLLMHFTNLFVINMILRGEKMALRAQTDEKIESGDFLFGLFLSHTLSE